jgi:hypothetical protein
MADRYTVLNHVGNPYSHHLSLHKAVASSEELRALTARPTRIIDNIFRKEVTAWRILADTTTKREAESWLWAATAEDAVTLWETHFGYDGMDSSLRPEFEINVTQNVIRIAQK